MEYLLVHKMIGPLPPEIQLKIIEVTKNRHEIGKKTGATEICSYKPIGKNGAICIWEAPNIEALKPLLDLLSNVGVETDVTPLEQSDKSLVNWEKTLQQMMKK